MGKCTPSQTVAGLVVVLTILLLPLFAHCLRFHLPPNTKRCLKEEMRKDVLVTGEYQLGESVGVRTDLIVSISCCLQIFAYIVVLVTPRLPIQKDTPP